MTALIIVLGFLIYITLYFTYGKKLERDVIKASDLQKAPSERLYDGVDYIAARKEVLFGHHFASIAGAAPIIGPALAICWGWAPALLWIWFGNIFIGAVHDYLSLMASVRYDGKSIQFVATDLMGKRTGYAFYWIVFFLLILVVAAFAAVCVGIYTKTPAVGSSYIFKIIAALILGVLIYRVKMNFWLATVIGIAMLCFALWLGVLFPIVLSSITWYWIIFFYIIIAASIPVNVLLQPRDYLNSWLLYAGLVLGFVAAIFAFHGFDVPAFTSFSPVLLGGKPTPFWPAIPLIIACGSLSGFHSLVASGTTSKQLDKESNGLFIGYGAMFSEGFLSTIVVVSIAGFGYAALKTAAAAKGIDFQLNAGNWAELFTPVSGKLGLSAANLFVQSYADMVGSTWLSFIPVQYVKVLAGMWVASFAMTTLDTTNRLARYCIAEMVAPIKDSSAGLYSLLTNRWVASFIPAAIGIWLAASGNWLIIWGSFGAANQLIAAIALMTGAGYVAKKLKSNFASAAVIPAFLLWITVTVGILWFMIVVQPDAIAKNPVSGWTILVLLVVMFILNFVFIYDFIKSKSYQVDKS